MDNKLILSVQKFQERSPHIDAGPKEVKQWTSFLD